jgi:hypothetical protein
MKRFFIALLPGLVMAFFSPHAQSGLNDWQNPLYIQKAFNEIALKNEYQTTDRRIIKWQTPIAYQFQYHDIPTNPLIENLFEEHFKHLASITGHAINPANSLQQVANLTIHLLKDAQYAKVIQQVNKQNIKNLSIDSNCMGTLRMDADKNIMGGDIVIPVDHAFSRGLLTACVVEEATQMMGLPNDSDWVNPSVANDASRLDLLTGLDYLFLRILYDPKLISGMPFEESQPIINRKIHTLQQSGVIDEAHKLVKLEGIYPLLFK